MRSFLTYLASERDVSASTQNQALNAIVFMYRHVLKEEIGDFSGFHPARLPRHLPVVLSAPEVVALLAHLTGMPLIHRRDGHGYSYAGLNAMLRRYTAKANGIATGRAATGINKDIDKSKLAIQPFGYYDLKAKGATDMWLAGVALERIQVLCGHESVTTTERYVKCRWRGTVTPNRVAMAV